MTFYCDFVIVAILEKHNISAMKRRVIRRHRSQRASEVVERSSGASDEKSLRASYGIGRSAQGCYDGISRYRDRV